MCPDVGPDLTRFWSDGGQLDVIVEKYNAVLTELLPVEEPLLEDVGPP